MTPELKVKLASFIIVALLLSSAFSGAVMVMANVNANINTTATDDEAPNDTDTTPPIIIDHSPTGDNVPVNASIRIAFSEAMNETSVGDAFSILPAVNGSFNWDGNAMAFIPDALSHNTTYSITIKEEAADLAGNNLHSSYSWEFATESQLLSPSPSPSPSPFPSAPILISNVSAVNITANSATITWKTNQPSDSLAKYGFESRNYISLANDFSYVTGHSIEITALIPDTTYYYVVNSTSDAYSNESADYNFTTLPEAEETVIQAPAIIGWFNNITNDNSTFININRTINKSQSICIFNATADQIIDTWHWYKDGVDQPNNNSIVRALNNRTSCIILWS